jgi:hypothetical protein
MVNRRLRDFFNAMKSVTTLVKKSSRYQTVLLQKEDGMVLHPSRMQAYEITPASQVCSVLPTA